jgi:hypothetical protein
MPQSDYEDPFEGCEEGEFNMTCSVEHHFTRHLPPITEAEYEEQEKQRLLQFPKEQRSFWCSWCGAFIDPCDYPTPREGLEAFRKHEQECRDAAFESEEGGE